LIKLSPWHQFVSLTNYAVPCVWHTASPELREAMGLGPGQPGPQCIAASTYDAEL